jgi:uncharacterized protein (DUF2062 family)
MLFRRRTEPTWQEKMRISLWPRRSWLRSAQYVAKRILRLSASPHAVAAGVAAGVFTSFSPFIGLHFLIAAILAFILRGNIVASALGTFFGNPLSVPIIWASTLSVGQTILGFDKSEHQVVHLVEIFRKIDISNFGHVLSDLWEPVIKPMFFGGVLLGLLFGLIFYCLTRWGIKWFHARRQKRIKAQN